MRIEVGRKFWDGHLGNLKVLCVNCNADGILLTEDADENKFAQHYLERAIT